MYNPVLKLGSLGLIFILAACQPLPQPFQPEQTKKAGNPLLRLPDRAGILVRPVTGLPAETAHELSAAVAAALIMRNIPAFTLTGNRESHTLSGLAKQEGAKKQVVWRLFGKGIHSGKSERIFTDAPPGNSSHGSTSALLSIADRVAVAIASRIQNPVARDRIATLKKRYLHVGTIAGPPEAAAVVLRNELKAALRRNSVHVSDTLQNNSLIVIGNVSRSATPAGKMHIAINWTLLLDDGRELGGLEQANNVGPIELDENWPEIARGIAISAATGLRGLLDQIQ